MSCTIHSLVHSNKPKHLSKSKSLLSAHKSSSSSRIGSQLIEAIKGIRDLNTQESTSLLLIQLHTTWKKSFKSLTSCLQGDRWPHAASGCMLSLYMCSTQNEHYIITCYAYLIGRCVVEVYIEFFSGEST